MDFFFSYGTPDVVGLGVLCEVPPSHSDTPHYVGHFWTRDWPVAETSDNTEHSPETDIRAPGGIRNGSSNKRGAIDPSIRPHGRWDQRLIDYSTLPLRWHCLLSTSCFQDTLI